MAATESVAPEQSEPGHAGPEAIKPRLLVVDDGLTYAQVVAEQMPEFELVRPDDPSMGPCLPDGPAALAFLERHASELDVILLDLHFDVPSDRLLPLGDGTSLRRTRRFQGVAILREIRRRFPGLPVVLLTAVEDLSLVDADGELAAQSMTYFLDGEDLDALRIRVNAALREAALGLEEAELLWGRNSAMQAVRRRLAVLARGKLPVVLEGETGTGKSFLAERFVHVNSGRKGPFVTVDLSTLPSELVSAHLFGAARGAYTGAVVDRKGVFELAHRGTLFIDEIQDIPFEIQKQLLLALQDGRVRPLGAGRELAVDVKVVAATNRPLAAAVEAGRFRSDLYMRLSPATRVVLPPLRERPGDLPFLARRFVAKALRDAGNLELRDPVAQAVGLPAGAPLTLSIGRSRGGSAVGVERGLELVLPTPVWQRLATHKWPGNVRELEMVMHNLVTFTLVGAVDALRAGLSLTSPRLQVDPGLVGELLAGASTLSVDGAPRPPNGRSDEGGESSGELAGYGQATPSRHADDADDAGEHVGALQTSCVHIEPQSTLNGVSTAVERQYFLDIFTRTRGQFDVMAEVLLGDGKKARAVRLRFNQLGLKVRELRR